MNKHSNQRFYASLLFVGASILLYRTVRMMLVENAFEQLVIWVSALLVIESILDLSCVLSTFRWFITNEKKDAGLPLKLAVAATILHAIRVFIYVLGRTGPWVNFDVKPAFHETYSFNRFWLYLASILSTLGIIGVILIWQVMKYKKRKSRNE